MGRKNHNKGEYSDFISYDKSSKKEKRKRDRERRNEWDFNPATKVIPSKKKKKKRYRDDYYNDYDEYDNLEVN